MMSLRIATVLAVADVARAQFTCTGVLKNKGSTPLCAGGTSSTCGAAQCCTTDSTVKTCSSVAGVFNAGGTAKCRLNSAALFFDTKKTSAVIASDSEADVKSKCCTATSDAKCSDWPTVCPSGHTKIGTNSAPADTGTPKLTISADEFKTKCCVKTCNNVAGILYAGGTAKCRLNSASLFFDTNKLSAVIASDSEADVKSKCCTATSDAKCSDWPNVCPSGHAKIGTNSAPADTGTPKLTISADEFKSKCCVTKMKCSDYSADTSGAFSKATSLGVAVAAAAFSGMI